MSDATTTAPEQQAPSPAARHRERAPKSADARQRGLAARKLARQLEALKASKDARKLEEAAVAMARVNGTPEPEEKPAAPPEAKAEPPKGEPLSAVPATADATKPGWPTEAALADAAPTVREVVDLAAVFLAGTRFDLLAKISVRVGDKVVERTKADVLAEKLTPLAAKYGASLQQSPEMVAAVGLVTVFGPPLVQPLIERALAKAGAARGLAQVAGAP